MSESTKLSPGDQNLYRMLFDAAGDAIIVCSELGSAIECNQGALILFGCTREQLLGTSPIDWSPEFQPNGRRSDEMVAEVFPRVKAEGMTRFDWENRIADGSPLSVEVSVRHAQIDGRDLFVVISRDMTERQKSEALRQDALDRFRKLTELVPGVVYQFRLRPDGSACMPYVSDAFRDMFHLDSDEVREDATKALMRAHPDDVENFMASIQTSAQNMAPWQHEYRLKFDDGTVRWVFGNGRPNRENDGSVLWHGFITDITERKQAEAAINVSENRFRSVFEKAYTGMAIADPEGNLLDANNTLALLLGYERGELIGMNIGRFTHADDLAVEMVYLREIAAGARDDYRMEKRYIRKSGEKIWVDLLVTVIRNEQVQAVSVFGLVVDITERKLAETALRDSEERFRSLFNNAEVAMLRSRSDGSEILDCNDKFLEITGRTRGEVIGFPSAIFWADLGQRTELAARLNAEGRVTDVDFALLNKKGEVRHCISSLRLFKEKGLLEGSILDITERKASADKIEHLAFYDSLTDLPNRRLLLDRLQQALVSSARHGRYGALMLLDMDDFKTLNDTLGHDVGDQFLVEVASRIRACVREGDTVGRQGGDEFVVILEDLDEDALGAMQAESVAVKILGGVSEPYQLDLSLQPGVKNTRSYHCTSSIGITLFRDNFLSADELMKRADTAMYRAKTSGRNSLRFFDPEMQTTVATRAALDNDLRNAIRDHQFLLYYQPQVDAAGRTTGAEALLRWQHPHRGMVSPAEFIPQTEETGLILPLGRWVLETACAQLVAWSVLPHLSRLTLAVNVSARQFRHPDFVDQVLAIIASTGANPNQLKLELTESLLLHDVGEIIAKMAALKAKGVGFSLDDFGTGYSSLAYLKRLPLDQLKIDQSFVKDVLTDPNDAAIARTIVALARSMGLAVIAEGVETEAQREFLAANGCTACQGYLFGRPVPIEEFEQFTKRAD